MSKTSNSKMLFISLGALLLTGCVGNATKPKSSVNSFADYSNGQYESAAIAVESDLGGIQLKTGELNKVDAKRADVLMHMDAGEFWRLSNKPSRSIEHFESVEGLFKEEDTSGFAETAGEQVGSVLVNDTVASYVPTPPERMLVNHYKALAYWSEGNKEEAGREFLRANERAAMTVVRYEKEIAKAKDEAKSNKNSGLSSQKGFKQSLYEKYPNVEEWEVYDSFVNPAVIYSNALLLGSSKGSKSEEARVLMKRVIAMSGENSVLASDMSELDKHTSLGKKLKNVWVVYETGASPRLKENRFNIPLPVDDQVVLISFALPEMVGSGNSFSGNPLTLNGKKLPTEKLASMEKVMRTEFKKRWPAVLSRASISAITKGLIQHQAGKENAMAGLFATIYTAASTKADTRMWQLMPNQWSVAKAPLISDSTLRIPYGKSQTLDVAINAETSKVVFIKQPTSFAKPHVTVVEM